MAKKEGRGVDSRGSHHQYKRGLWTVEEDKILMDYVAAHGQGRWNVIAKRTGRCTASLFVFSHFNFLAVCYITSMRLSKKRESKSAGLRRCGKSCRLRWMNYLRPDVKRDGFTEEEEDLVIRLHKLLGNRFNLSYVSSIGCCNPRI